MSMSDIIFTWGPRFHLIQATGEHHYYTSFARYAIDIDHTPDPEEEVQADNNTQITLPTERFLRNFRLKVAPTGVDGQPGNTSGNNTSDI